MSDRSLSLLALLVAACGPAALVTAGPATPLPPGHPAVIAEDVTPKEELRLLPAEAWVRTYLQLFGGLAPLEAQRRARGGDGGQLFDGWNDYLTALGFPDYRLDLPRALQTNAIMVATFERLGDALCDRSVEHDLVRPATPLAERVLFAFALPARPVSEVEFAPRFDLLHRAILGYPAALANTERTAAFYRLYRGVLERHAAPGAPKSRFTPPLAGWSVVCQALIRHPEFALY